MHLQFLVEDYSSNLFIEQIMSQLSKRYEYTYDIKPFSGIGGFKKSNKISEIKTKKLLNDLPSYLRGFDRNFSQYEAAIIVVLDNDTRDTCKFRDELYEIAAMAMITIDHVFCIAIEELEAWILGDRDAILTAYPNARISVLNNYEQDSICGTWEVLADILYKGGCAKLKKNCKTYSEIGKLKCEWAGNIAKYIDVNRNVSPSFSYFINEILKRINPVY